MRCGALLSGLSDYCSGLCFLQIAQTRLPCRVIDIRSFGQTELKRRKADWRAQRRIAKRKTFAPEIILCKIIRHQNDWQFGKGVADAAQFIEHFPNPTKIIYLNNKM
ncbi:MAG: hypothetical protein FD162_886 [Rhodobacteraceae bacterium]|nr:MAG: hypothetical protein FD162_886 [Paracoccaceae bacterium]